MITEIERYRGEKIESIKHAHRYIDREERVKERERERERWGGGGGGKGKLVVNKFFSAAFPSSKYKRLTYSALVALCFSSQNNPMK